jgi:hypothetical protein
MLSCGWEIEGKRAKERERRPAEEGQKDGQQIHEHVLKRGVRC